jgi:hypothetical protein
MMSCQIVLNCRPGVHNSFVMINFTGFFKHDIFRLAGGTRGPQPLEVYDHQNYMTVACIFITDMPTFEAGLFRNAA